MDSFQRGHIQKAKDQAEILGKRLAQVPSESKARDAEAKAIEIRAYLEKVPELDRLAVLEEALASGETEVLSALFEGPTFIQRSLVPMEDFRSDLRPKQDQLSARWGQAAGGSQPTRHPIPKQLPWVGRHSNVVEGVPTAYQRLEFLLAFHPGPQG